MWKNDVKITLNESYLYYDGSGINLIGKFLINFDDLNNFWRVLLQSWAYLVPKMSQDGPQDDPKMARNGPRKSQDGPL